MTYEVKVGARNNQADANRLQMIHDYAVENGAMCGEGKALDISEDAPAFIGEAVKALDDGGKVGGYLVRFSTENDPDLTGDFFTKDTDFGETEKLPVLYHHGFDKTIGKRKIGIADLRRDEVGIWAEAQLSLRDEYEKKIFELAKAGKLGWSSGAAAHVVDRIPTAKAAWIKQWYLAEASLTPAPAEYRNQVTPIKSLIPSEQAAGVVEDDNKNNNPNNSIMEGNKMEQNEIEALVNTVAQSAVKTAVEEFVKSLPETKTGYNVQVVEDEADKALKENPFKSAGEFMKSVVDAANNPYSIDQRLLPLKASGLNENTPSQGGFLVPPQYAAGIRERMYNTGQILGRLNVTNVSGNTMVYNVLDETSRATGSRAGGLQGYWLNEGGTKTASKPKFDQISLKLKKVAALAYATDELLADTSALDGFLMRHMADELRFLVEDAVVEGDGVGKPLGILNSPALISATRTNASQVAAADIAGMWARRWVGANDYVWLIDQSVHPQLVNMTVGNWPVYVPAGGFNGAPYASLYGRPIIESEYSKALGSVGDVMLVSFSEIAAIAKGGVEMASSIHVQFLTDEQVFRAVYRFDAQPFWKSALTPFNGGNTVSPFVALAATT